MLSGRPGNGDLEVTTGIEITVTDGAGDSAGLEEFDLTVIDGNEQPVATTGITGSVDEDDGAGVDITLVGSDVDAGETATLTFQVDPGSPADGTVTVSGNTAHYTPTTADFNGLDSFTFTVTDTSGTGTAVSTAATVNVTINPVQDQPVATPGNTGNVDEDDAAGVDITLSGSDADAGETATLTFQVDTGSPTNGTVSVSGNKAHYTPTTADYYGGDSFTFTVTDTSGTGNDVSTAATVDVTIDNTNDAPTVSTPIPDQALRAMDFPAALDLSAYFSDVDALDNHAYSVTANSDDATVGPGIGALAGSTLTLDIGSGGGGPVTITVRATDDGAGALWVEETFNVSITSYGPYINGVDWNDYVKNDQADIYSADDVACDGSETDGYDACIHGGEVRAFNTG